MRASVSSKNNPFHCLIEILDKRNEIVNRYRYDYAMRLSLRPTLHNVMMAVRLHCALLQWNDYAYRVLH